MAANGKYALTTSVTSGIGFELAKLFTQDGYNLVIVARGTDGGLEQTASTLKASGIDVITLSKDLLKQKEAASVYDEVKAKGVVNDSSLLITYRLRA